MIRLLLTDEFKFVSGGDGPPINNNSGNADVGSKVNQAVSLINSIYGSLNSQGQQGFDSISSISIDAHSSNTTSHIDPDTGHFHIDANEAANESVSYIASTILHDGYHEVQYKNGEQLDTVQSEQAATQVQIDNANALGMSSSDTNFLQRYHDDPDAIQCRLNQAQGKPCESAAPPDEGGPSNDPGYDGPDPGKGDGGNGGDGGDGDPDPSGGGGDDGDPDPGYGDGGGGGDDNPDTGYGDGGSGEYDDNQVY